MRMRMQSKVGPYTQAMEVQEGTCSGVSRSMIVNRLYLELQRALRYEQDLMA